MSRTATATRPGFRVACPEYTADWFTSLAAAQRWMTGVENVGVCRELHAIEVRDGHEWVPLHIHWARQILAAPVSLQPVDTPDGPLVKYTGGWSAETGARTVGEAGSREWFDSLGAHEHATLTSDGRGANRQAWCQCAPEPNAATWVRYEHWTNAGREAHGYVCPECRCLVQVG